MFKCAIVGSTHQTRAKQLDMIQQRQSGSAQPQKNNQTKLYIYIYIYIYKKKERKKREKENEEGRNQVKGQKPISTSHHTSCHFIDCNVLLGPYDAPFIHLHSLTSCHFYDFF